MYADFLRLLTAAFLTLVGLPGCNPVTDESAPAAESSRVAVETAEVERGAIQDLRRFTGTLLPAADFIVAPKVGGRIERIHYDIGDEIERGAVVAVLDADEAEQTVAQAEAELEVARAQRAQAVTASALAEREMERSRSLRERALISASDMDTAEAKAATDRVAVQLAEAQVAQRKATLAAANVQLEEHRVRANWLSADFKRVVGERFENAGGTIAANTPILSVLEIESLLAAMHVSERDYPHLRNSQQAVLTSDVLPGERFAGVIERLAPAFSETSRQALVEVAVDNSERRLKPGMFVTVSVVVDAAENAILIPATALVERGNEDVVFTVEDGRARRVPVTPGIRNDGRVQILQPETLTGEVVTLGQQLLEDGVRVEVAGPLAARE